MIVYMGKGGAGILPTTIYKNQIYFLFGKENKYDDTPGWSDFAGGNETGETFLQTAIREGTEELTGFLGTQEDLKLHLKRFGYYPIQFDLYRTHLLPMEHDPKLPFYYNNNQYFLQRHLAPSVIKNTKIFEKEEIRWMNYRDIQKNMGSFRPFYKNILHLLVSNRKPIEKFVKASLKKRQTRKNKVSKKNKRSKTVKR